jgi:hypothetical protein
VPPRFVWGGSQIYLHLNILLDFFLFFSFVIIQLATVLDKRLLALNSMQLTFKNLARILCNSAATTPEAL